MREVGFCEEGEVGSSLWVVAAQTGDSVLLVKKGPKGVVLHLGRGGRVVVCRSMAASEWSEEAVLVETIGVVDWHGSWGSIGEAW